MLYASICSGVGSCALALKPLGYECAFFAEVDPFPSSVLQHHWPNVPNLRNFTEINTDEWTQKKYRNRRSIQLVVGGTPCQSYSLAGSQQGMDDKRGSLALEHVRLARALGSTWFVWENVPGALSTNGGEDFARILDALVECGYGWAYRVLDAQYFGVAQRRRRIFLIGYLGDWRPPTAVLFEPKGLSRNLATMREPRKRSSDRPGTSTSGDSKKRKVFGAITPSNIATGGITGGNNPGASHVVVARAINTKQGRGDATVENYVCSRDESLRKLTPLECERLMGMPDNHTLVPYNGSMAKDTPRYKAIGNGFAVPVVRWIGQRILDVSNILEE